MKKDKKEWERGELIGRPEPDGPSIIYHLQPYGVNATCHICDPPAEFSTILELQNHVRDIHRIWKG